MMRAGSERPLQGEKFKAMCGFVLQESHLRKGDKDKRVRIICIRAPKRRLDCVRGLCFVLAVVEAGVKQIERAQVLA